MKKKLISVVTVCLNAQDVIEKTIQSVIYQDFKDKEYLIIDGASIDRTLEIVQVYHDEIDVLVSEPDKGIYNAMNKAIDLASGEWLIFMNAGDFFVDSKVLSNISCFLVPSVDVVYGDILIKKSGKLILKESPSRIKNIHRMPFCHQAVFTRLSLLRKYRFDENYALSSDFKFFKQLILGGFSFRKVDLPITVYDRSGLSNIQRTRGLSENIEIIKEIDKLSKQIGLLPRLYFVKHWNQLRCIFKKVIDKQS
ncbi:MAG: glycosyltransferase family 2 protein [Proteiniphilum sp.]